MSRRPEMIGAFRKEALVMNDWRQHAGDFLLVVKDCGIWFGTDGPYSNAFSI